MRRALALIALGFAGAGLITSPTSASPSPMPAPAIVPVYDEVRSAIALFRAKENPLSPERGGRRQHPGPGGVFRADDEAYRLGKVKDAELLNRSPEGMAGTLRHAIETSGSGVVFLDEIGAAWADVAGRPSKSASNLAVALRDLGQVAHPAGGSYASRIHIYLSPSFGATAANPAHSGKRRWDGMDPALARAGGVWVEMYRKAGKPLEASVFRDVMPNLDRRLRAAGGSGAGQLHFTFSAANRRPAGAPASCGEPMACQWSLASQGAVNRRVLANGPGAYRVGRQAPRWLAEFNARFI